MPALERALARFRPDGRPPGRRRPGPAPSALAAPRLSAAAFRAVVEERLRSLEREAGELKGRLNGLIFLVAGTVIAQVVLKLVQ